MIKLSSYLFADLAIAAAMERNPALRVSNEALSVIQKECGVIDEEFCTGEFDIRADVADERDCVIVMTHQDSFDPYKCWIFEGVFEDEQDTPQKT